jgi:hypothetical protein
MRLIFASCLILGGAVAGGVFPGGLLAFFLAVGSGLSGSAGEIFCFVVNLVFGIGGAFCGGLFARVIRPGARWGYNVLFPTIAGLVTGAAGYFWLEWAISHAEPPL